MELLEHSSRLNKIRENEPVTDYIHNVKEMN
jgi:hypothetical protein